MAGLDQQARDRDPVLIVGGGICGMSAAVLLRRIGIGVDLVEIDPEWRVYGAGISITGPSFRAFERLGILRAVRERGFNSNGALRVHDPAGRHVADIPTHPIAPGLPSSGGIMRPVLHQILRDAVTSAGAEVRLGVTVAAFEQDAEGVAVRFTDGGAGHYRAVIGADGAFSALRGMVFPQAPAPRYTGQYCWRLNAPRPFEVTQPYFFMAGQITAGLMPVSEAQMYMWLLQPSAEKYRLADADLPAALASIMAPFGGLLGDIRDQLEQTDVVTVRPLEALLLPSPWYDGRIILIGDAAHATTPHLASGAGIAVEDALVLAECLQAEETIAAAFARFMQRRFERARMVVESSVEIGAMQQGNASPDRLKALMGQAEAALRADI